MPRFEPKLERAVRRPVESVERHEVQERPPAAHEDVRAAPKPPEPPSPKEEARLAGPKAKELSEKDAATIFQKHFRGRAARKETVLPSEIRTFLDGQTAALKTKDGAEVDTGKLSQALAKHIKDLQGQPGKLEGHGTRVSLGKDFKVVDTAGAKKELGLADSGQTADFWVRKSADGKGLEVEVIGEELGTGAFKVAHKSNVLHT